MYYGFEYFAGANVTVKVGDMTILEASGISVDYQNSKRPIYGYSSRYFDAVAEGQSLVTGTLLVNYVHQDYLFHLIEMEALGRNPALSLVEPPSRNQSTLTPEEATLEFQRDLERQASTAETFGQGTRTVQSLKDRYWNNTGSGSSNLVSPIRNTRHVVDLGNSIDMKVIFGEQNSGDRKNGDTGILIRGCHFTGSSKVIRVSEETIVEAYPFFAQRLYSLQNPSLIEESQNEDLEDSTLIESVTPKSDMLFDPTKLSTLNS